MNELESHLEFAALPVADENNAGFLLFVRASVGHKDGGALLHGGRKGDESAMRAHTEHLGGFGELLVKLA